MIMTCCPSSIAAHATEWGQDRGHGEHSGTIPPNVFEPRKFFIKTYSKNKNIAHLKIIFSHKP